MSEMVERVTRAVAEAWFGRALTEAELPNITARFAEQARAAIEAMRDVENDTLAAGYEAMFTDKWDGTQAPMMGAGWEAMIDAALTLPPSP